MGAIIGRENELSYLESLHSNEKSGVCAIYGRRRVGKTYLIEEFCKDKRTIYITSVEGAERVNLEIIWNSMRTLDEKLPKFESFLDVVNALDSICSDKKTVIVFDEFPNLVESSKSVPSILQSFIDRNLPRMNAMLIICGSSISSMKNEIYSYDRPLYGRFDRKMEIRPIPYQSCREFHPSKSDLDFLKAYMTVGGIPLYQIKMDGSTYSKCIIKNFMGPFPELFEEAQAIVHRELTPSKTYSDLLYYMAQGATRLKHIADKMNISSVACSRYLENLMFLDMVERVTPMANSPRHPIYRVKDSMLRFYYTVVQHNLGVFKSLDVKASYANVESEVNTFLGRSFEYVCEEYIRSHYVCKETGRWWGRVNGTDADIDLIATVLEDGHEVSLFCECKFSKNPVGMGVYNALKERSEHVKGLNNRKYMLFSTAGFDERLHERTDCITIDLKELLSPLKAKRDGMD